MIERWTCESCGKLLHINEVYTLKHVGPEFSLKGFCSECADNKLSEYRERRKNDKKA